jgi:hypothetical protein
MGLFKKSPEKMEESREYMQMETELANQKLELVQRQAAIKELERNYGPAWKKILGVNGPISLESLRGFLKGAHSGLAGQAGKSGSGSTSAFPKMPSVLPNSNMHRS